MLTSAHVVVSYLKVEIETAMMVIVEMGWACRNLFSGVASLSAVIMVPMLTSWETDEPIACVMGILSSETSTKMRKYHYRG
jgi:hypothetical protein